MSSFSFAEIAIGAYLGGFVLAMVSVFVHDALGLD